MPARPGKMLVFVADCRKTQHSLRYVVVELNLGDDQCEIVNRRSSFGKLAELGSNTLLNLRCRLREHTHDCFAEATLAEFLSRWILSFRNPVRVGKQNITVTEWNLSRVILTRRH